MIYWATCALAFDGGINITASHNPKEYNGIKIVARGGHSICGDELQEILKLAQKRAHEKYKAPNTEIPEETPVSEQYIADLLHRAELHKTLKIVIDAGNATTGAFAPELFTKFGCDVIPLYCDLDGNYPHHEANPEETKNMADLAAKVKETGAACGVAFDGDGDRVGIVDEKGNHHSADYLLLLLARDLLKHMPNSQVVFDVKVSQILMNGIRDAGGIPVMSKTGHSFIESRMKELKAPLGGEISGHFFFAENYYGFDDAFLAALRLLSIFSQSENPVSSHFETLPKMSTTPEYKLRCPDDRKFNIIKDITGHFTQNYPCITIDGVRVNFDTSSWGAIRCSNTSPNLTARFEAPTEERLKKIKQIFIEELKKYPEVDVSPML
jgi:phosphomannomutase/phosphoglucomutase